MTTPTPEGLRELNERLATYLDTKYSYHPIKTEDLQEAMDALRDFAAIKAQQPSGAQAGLVRHDCLAVQELRNIVAANYRKWEAGLDTPENFVQWAQNRARWALEKIDASPLPGDGGDEPVAWRVRRGMSNMWGYCENESDADFLGGAGQMEYVKQPLYTHPSPLPASEPDKICESCGRHYLGEPVAAQVTDEVVEAALDVYQHATQGTLGEAMRAALEAVAPMLAQGNGGKDAERLDWLDKQDCGFDHVSYGDYRYYSGAAGGEYGFKAAREAIDAAIAAQKEEGK